MFTEMLIIISIELIIIIYLMVSKKNTEFFDNLESNLYTYDTCCTEKQIKNCESYGNTGVCDYNNNINSCICQNSF
jgi:hypothetical protein